MQLTYMYQNTRPEWHIMPRVDRYTYTLVSLWLNEISVLVLRTITHHIFSTSKIILSLSVGANHSNIGNSQEHAYRSHL